MNKASKLSMKIANIFSNDSNKKEKATAQITAQAAELEALQEKARKEALIMTKTSRCGFPHKPTCIAYDCVQHLLAIGTKYGYVKLFGGDSIEYTIFHGASAQTSNASPLTTQSFGTVSSVSTSTSQTGTDKQASSGNGGGGSGVGGGGALSSAYMNTTPSASTVSLNFGSAVMFMSFVINEGALITYCEDTTLTFWNLRQKQPGVLFNRKLVNEKYEY